jgi:hypothetical protein
LSLLDRIEGTYQKLAQGGAGLTIENLKEFTDVGNQFLQNYQRNQNDTVALIQQQAQSYGLDVNNILTPGTINTYQDSLKQNAFEDLSPGISYQQAVRDYGQEFVNNYLKDNGFSDFSSVGGDTKQAPEQQPIVQATAEKKVGDQGGQCGHFVNQLTGIRMGDSVASKMAYTDPSIGKGSNPPRPGDIFVMPYKDTGHTGMVLSATPKPDGSYDVQVIDSNWHMNEKVDIHTLNSAQKRLSFGRSKFSS